MDGETTVSAGRCSWSSDTSSGLRARHVPTVALIRVNVQHRRLIFIITNKHQRVSFCYSSHGLTRNHPQTTERARCVRGQDISMLRTWCSRVFDPQRPDQMTLI